MQGKKFFFSLDLSSGFPGGSDTKELPTMRETQVPSLGQKDPLEIGSKLYYLGLEILLWRVQTLRNVPGSHPATWCSWHKYRPSQVQAPPGEEGGSRSWQDEDAAGP